MAAQYLPTPCLDGACIWKVPHPLALYSADANVWALRVCRARVTRAVHPCAQRSHLNGDLSADIRPPAVKHPGWPLRCSTSAAGCAEAGRLAKGLPAEPVGDMANARLAEGGSRVKGEGAAVAAGPSGDLASLAPGLRAALGVVSSAAVGASTC